MVPVVLCLAVPKINRTVQKKKEFLRVADGEPRQVEKELHIDCSWRKPQNYVRQKGFYSSEVRTYRSIVEGLHTVVHNLAALFAAFVSTVKLGAT